RRENDHLTPALHSGPRGLRSLEEVEPLVHALSAKPGQLPMEPLVERILHRAISRMTLPACPFLITAIASAISSSPNRWVTTGIGSRCPLRIIRPIVFQVSYLFRPVTPYRVSPLKMISRAKSTSVLRLGVPSRFTLPPSLAAANAWAWPAGWPLISQTRS